MLLLNLTAESPVKGVPGGSDGKESACNAEDLSLILGSGRSAGERDGNMATHYSNLAWRIPLTEEWNTAHGPTVHGVANSQT